MAKTRQVDRAIEKFDADQLAAFRERHFIKRCPVVVGQMALALRRIGMALERLISGADRKCKAGAKSVRRSHQIAEIERFRHAFGANGKIALG